MPRATNTSDNFMTIHDTTQAATIASKKNVNYSPTYHTYMLICSLLVNFGKLARHAMFVVRWRGFRWQLARVVMLIMILHCERTHVRWACW